LDDAVEAQVLRGSNRILDAMKSDVELLTPHLTEVRLKPGDVLCEPGDTIDAVYFFHSGLVSKVTAFSDGQEIECAMTGRNGAAGVMSALGVTIAVTRDVCHLQADASKISVAALSRAAAASPRIHDVLDRYCAWKMSCAIRSGACNACHAVEQRLCRWLLMCMDMLGEPDIRLPQEVFAAMLGVQRTSINPVLRSFQASGLLHLGRSRVRIVDSERLQARACECYAAMQQAETMILGPICEVSEGSPAPRQAQG
jgi:CRP-like cAMP-binding protein